VALFDLGIPEVGFWELTLRNLHALYGRYDQARNRQESIFARGVAYQVNAHRWSFKEQVTGLDLFPHLKEEKEKPTLLTPIGQVAGLRAWMDTGKIIKRENPVSGDLNA
jgi:hypothetical protein